MIHLREFLSASLMVGFANCQDIAVAQLLASRCAIGATEATRAARERLAQPKVK